MGRDSERSWQADGLRLTVFPVEPSAEAEKGWWKEVVGSDPARESRDQGGLRFAEVGEVETYELSLIQQPSRIDWFLKPQEPAPDAGGDMPAAVAFGESLEFLLGLLRKWLADLHVPIKRIALALDLSMPQADRSAAYRALAAKIPALSFNPAEARDVVLRINIPVKSTVEEGLGINRLTTWSCVSRSLFRLELARGRAAQTPLSEAFYIRAEMDLNTEEEREAALPQGDLGPLLTELAELARGALVEGVVEQR